MSSLLCRCYVTQTSVGIILVIYLFVRQAGIDERFCYLRRRKERRCGSLINWKWKVNFWAAEIRFIRNFERGILRGRSIVIKYWKVNCIPCALWFWIIFKKNFPQLLTTLGKWIKSVFFFRLNVNRGGIYKIGRCPTGYVICITRCIKKITKQFQFYRSINNPFVSYVLFYKFLGLVIK